MFDHDSLRRTRFLVCWILPLASPLVGCASSVPDDSLALTYDPCAARVFVEDGATPEELASVDSALRLWDEHGSFGLVRVDPAEATEEGDIALRFLATAPFLHGVYEPETGLVTVNRTLTDDRERTITVAHELGHAFGLPHMPPADAPSVMNPGNLVVVPTADDVAGLLEIWGACDAAPAP